MQAVTHSLPLGIEIGILAFLNIRPMFMAATTLPPGLLMISVPKYGPFLPIGPSAGSGSRLLTSLGADRGDHGAGDNRPDARDAHQPNARGIPLGKLFDLAR